VPVDDRDLLPADSTAADTGQVIEISPVLGDAEEPHRMDFLRAARAVIDLGKLSIDFA